MKEITIRELKENPVKLISEDWALLTVKDAEKGSCNPMTVSWGGVGELWGADMATIYVRESRYTKTLLDNEDYFSLCFFGGKQKEALSFCGSKSGRDINKTEACGLTPNFDEAAPYFEEAKLVLVCKKMAKSKFDPKEFIDDTVEDKWYPEKDFHYIYFAEIEKVLISE